MIAQLASRGPDGEGYFVEAGIGLGHARLSIIDLKTGGQPIHNEDSSVWTTFNGEIFNYLELRAELEKSGHRFYTNTDTEVIVHSYEEYGDEFIHRLNGQFAIALWDRVRRRLLLVRDRAGILPLFYAQNGDRLIFASEIKALLPAISASPRLNIRALDQIMTFWAPVSPETIFDGVFEVGPGEMLAIETGVIKRRRYWDWVFPSPGEHRIEAEDALVEELQALLIDATTIRLRADVPVAAYLSGGLDSSGITALIKKHSNTQIRTFSLTFDDREVDESSHQRRVVEHLKTDHSSISCSAHDIAYAFPQTIVRTETPILRTAPVPMGMLSGHVREQGYKVVLTGEGADEVLGGYDLFKETKIRQFWAKNPDSTFRAALLKRLYPYLSLQQRQNPAYLRKFFGEALDNPENPYFSHIPRWTTTARTKAFFADSLTATLTDDAIGAQLDALPQAFNQWHPFNRAQYLEAKTLMSGYLLCSQGDRMLMANSVEGRFPFLDHRVIEFANRLHPKYMMRGLNEKHLLKRALAPYLPSTTVARFKQPYRAPDIEAFFGSGTPPDYVMERLSAAAIRGAGYFDAGRVALLIRKIRAGKAIGFKDNMAFIGILSTQLWHQHFVEGFHKHFA
jgi:asparagine synthase (glutamine-hydrolysing)